MDDASLRKMIQDAEDAAGDKTCRFVKDGEMVEHDADLLNYNRIRLELSPEGRMKLAADYELYKEIKSHLNAIRLTAGQYVSADGSHVGPLVLRFLKSLQQPPAQWRVCAYCKGTGENAQVDKCLECKGAGYVIR